MVKKITFIVMSNLILFSFCFANGDSSVDTQSSNMSLKLTPKMKVIPSAEEDLWQEKFTNWKKKFLDIQILTNDEYIENTPRVISDKDGKVMSIENDQIYVNKLANTNFYKPMAVYRINTAIIDRATKKVLGYPFYYLSNVQLVKHNVANNLSLLKLFDLDREVIIGDRILNKYNDKELNFNKLRKNKNKINAKIVSIVDGVKRADIGHNIIINLGTKDKVKAGDLLQVEKALTIKRSVQLHEDGHFTEDHFFRQKRDKNRGKYVDLPKERIATILIYRVFKNVSLALVIDGKEPVQLNQEVVGFQK